MLKISLRFLVITLIAVALGFLIYHLNQPAGTASLRSGLNNFGHVSRDFGGEGGFREGGFSLVGGLFGITGNLLLVALVTFIVVSMQKTFVRKAVLVRTR
jgi:hypothetical protein